jgi:hypothetical protein
MKPPTRTWQGEEFICARCDSTDMLNCPVCRAVIISDPVVLRDLESERGIVCHVRCRATRWLWSPAGRRINFVADWIIGLSGLAIALSLWAAAVVFVGRIILKVF